MTTIYTAFIYFGNKDEDSSENPFIWGRVVTKNPRDEDGNPVKNPGSIMVYGAKGISSGDCGRKVLIGRGLPGLYDLVPADKVEELLEELEMEAKDLPEVPLAETRAAASTVDRAEASKKASAVRQARRGSRTMTMQVAETQPA